MTTQFRHNSFKKASISALTVVGLGLGSTVAVPSANAVVTANKLAFSATEEGPMSTINGLYQVHETDPSATVTFDLSGSEFDALWVSDKQSGTAALAIGGKKILSGGEFEANRSTVTASDASGTWAVIPNQKKLTYTPLAGVTSPHPSLAQLAWYDIKQSSQGGISEAHTYTLNLMPFYPEPVQTTYRTEMKWVDAAHTSAESPAIPLDYLKQTTLPSVDAATRENSLLGFAAGFTKRTAPANAVFPDSDFTVDSKDLAPFELNLPQLFNSVTVPGEGKWEIKLASAPTNNEYPDFKFVFTPETGFNGTPSPIGYEIYDSGVIFGVVTSLQNEPRTTERGETLLNGERARVVDQSYIGPAYLYFTNFVEPDKTPAPPTPTTVTDNVTPVQNPDGSVNLPGAPEGTKVEDGNNNFIIDGGQVKPNPANPPAPGTYDITVTYPDGSKDNFTITIRNGAAADNSSQCVMENSSKVSPWMWLIPLSILGLAAIPAQTADAQAAVTEQINRALGIDKIQQRFDELFKFQHVGINPEDGQKLLAAGGIIAGIIATIAAFAGAKTSSCATPAEQK